MCLKILIIEDDPDWRDLVEIGLSAVGGDLSFEWADTKEGALGLIESTAFDLFSVDLSLLGHAESAEEADEEGMELLGRIKASAVNEDAAVLVLTAHANLRRLQEITRKKQAFRLIEKCDFTDELVGSAQAALLESRVSKAKRARSEQPRIFVQFDQQGWTGCQLAGPATASYPINPAISWDLGGFSDQGDELGKKGRSAREEWRSLAKFLGKQLYEVATRDARLASRLASVLSAPLEAAPVASVQLVGPAAGLRVPFEVLRDANDYLALRHPLTRKVVGDDLLPNAKEEPFHRFLEGKKGLRLVIVGADVDDSVANVGKEAAEVEAVVRLELEQRLGIQVAIESLVGADATVKRLKKALKQGFHVLHYAGHGRFNEDHPDHSGMVLLDEQGERECFSAGRLKTLVEGSALQLVYLSSCSLAKTATRAGRGDFFGMAEALLRGGVPTVLGFRWPMRDESAPGFAKSFYSELCRSLSPGRALLAARKWVVEEGTLDRDDSAWASSILVSQAGD